MKWKPDAIPGFGAVVLTVAVAAVLVMAHLPAPAPRATWEPTTPPVFQLCAAGDDDRMDDWNLDDLLNDTSLWDEEWTQGSGIGDLWRIDRTWRRPEEPLRATIAPPVPLTPQAFDPHQRWLRIPGLPASKLRQAESSTLDIFRLGDTIYAWSGDRWYRSDKAAPGYRAADPKELPADLQAVPARNWHRFPAEWADKSAALLSPSATAEAARFASL